MEGYGDVESRKRTIDDLTITPKSRFSKVATVVGQRGNGSKIPAMPASHPLTNWTPFVASIRSNECRR